jgi:hypothetical protein
MAWDLNKQPLAFELIIPQARIFGEGTTRTSTQWRSSSRAPQTNRLPGALFLLLFAADL